MAISLALRGTPLHTSTDNTTFAMTDAGTPTADRLLLAMVHRPGSDVAPTSFTGYGVSWTLLGAKLYSSGSFGWLGFYTALSGGSPNSTDPIVTFASSAVACHMTMYEITLASYAGTAVGCFRDQGAGVYVVSATGFSTTASTTLAAASDSANRPFASTASYVSATITPRASWTELEEAAALTTPTSLTEDEWRSDAFETTASSSWTGNSEWIILATEILNDPAPGAAGAAVDPMGMTGFFGG